MIAVGEMLYKYGKRKRHEAKDKTPNEQQQEPPTRVWPMPAATPYIIVRRDGAVWAGPWKNDGRSFTRVPKNWWTFSSRERAEKEIATDDFLRHCTVEEAE